MSETLTRYVGWGIKRGRFPQPPELLTLVVEAPSMEVAGEALAMAWWPSVQHWEVRTVEEEVTELMDSQAFRVAPSTHHGRPCWRLAEGAAGEVSQIPTPPVEADAAEGAGGPIGGR